MPHFDTSRRVRHTPTEMFDLVADVEKYPDFLPLCERLKVRGRNDLGDGREVLVADMTVGYKMFRETFTSRVTLAPEERVIRVEYLDGPFDHLDNRWSFVPEADGSTTVRFVIDYAFKNRVLAALMGAVFDRAVQKYSEAFEQRADTIYGRPGSVASA
ncbi:MAG: type II toxin-antitoxin system RatA family toxin [Ancalomicrobiaceae bacterium]|nr:type II toxin-antitoxin system RatA family toxin [Ancalomicrobiaceae bacterium]